MTDINYLDYENIVIIYNGQIFPIDIDDNSYENINYVISMIGMICENHNEYSNMFFFNNRIKEELLKEDADKLFEALYTFKDCRDIIFGNIGKYNGKRSLYIEGNTDRNLFNTKEFRKIYSVYLDSFKYIIYEGSPILSRNDTNESKNDDISLSSFKPKKELHPKIWIKNSLNSRVRLRLLDIADDFIDELSLNWVKPKDIVFTGSLANYNWSRYSDIDVHIIYDFKKVYKKENFVDDYFKSKKENWNNQHGKITIYGFPVEISVENSNEKAISSGVYSLNKNKWITEPSDFDDAKLNEKLIKEKAVEVMDEIDSIKHKLEKEEDLHKIEVLSKKLKNIFKRIKKSRQEGLKRSGEMATMNIVYKLLRRTKYIDIIWDLINKSYNKINSIK